MSRHWDERLRREVRDGDAITEEVYAESFHLGAWEQGVIAVALDAYAVSTEAQYGGGPLSGDARVHVRDLARIFGLADRKITITTEAEE